MWIWITLGVIAVTLVSVLAIIVFGILKIDRMHKELEELTHLEDDEEEK